MDATGLHAFDVFQADGRTQEIMNKTLAFVWAELGAVPARAEGERCRRRRGRPRNESPAWRPFLAISYSRFRPLSRRRALIVPWQVRNREPERRGV